MTFELPLTEPRVKPHQVTALHLLVGLACLGAGALLYRFYEPARYWSLGMLGFGLVLMLVALFRNKWVVQPRISRPLRIAELLVLVSLTGFFAIQKWPPPGIMFGVLSATVLLALFWEKGPGDVLWISIDDSGVKLPMNARRRHINWPDVEQVLLKYGTLTLSCTDNRIYQWTLGSIAFDIPTFQAYCNKQVEEGKAKRDKNDW